MVFAVKNRITVKVAGNEYVLLTEESGEYVLKVAEIVNSEIKQLTDNGKLILSDAAVLSCFNMCDKLQKETDNTAHLRQQIKSHLDENQKLKAELAEARREITRLKSANK